MVKDLNYYLALPYSMIITPDNEEGGYTISCPELPGCLTCVDRTEDIIPMFEDAKKVWLTAAVEDGISIPEPGKDENEYSGQFKLRMPKSLHKSIAEHSKLEGVSMNQYCLYLLSMNDAKFVQ